MAGRERRFCDLDAHATSGPGDEPRLLVWHLVHDLSRMSSEGRRRPLSSLLSASGLRPRQRGVIRTVAGFGPSPCMIGTASLPGYFASYAASIASETSSPAGSNVTS